jgi:hypothetical protein
LATAFAAPAQADTRLAHVTKPTLVNAYNGAVVWSAYDEANHVYRLTAYRRGSITTLPVPPSDSVFDADLGVDANAKLAVVYSRCDKPRDPLPFIAAPTAADCDLYLYKFGAPAEQKLTRFSRPGVAEFLPSIWGNRIAFARTQRNAQGGDCISYVWTGAIRSGRQKRLAKGTLGSYKGGPPCRVTTMPTSIDLRARVVAFGWYYTPPNCDDGSELWLVRIGRKPKKLEGRCGGYRFTPVSLTRYRLFDMSFGSVIRTNVSYFAPSLRRFDLGSGAYFEARQKDSDSFGVSDGQQIYVLRQVSGDPEATGYDVVSKPLAGFDRSRRDPG